MMTDTHCAYWEFEPLNNAHNCRMSQRFCAQMDGNIISVIRVLRTKTWKITYIRNGKVYTSSGCKCYTDVFLPILCSAFAPLLINCLQVLVQCPFKIQHNSSCVAVHTLNKITHQDIKYKQVRPF
jgi:hypothetical protein